MENEIIEKLTPIFRKVFKEPALEITATLSANDVEKWDSLSHLILISTVESEFGVKFKLKELVAMKNASDLIKLIETKLQ